MPLHGPEMQDLESEVDDSIKTKKKIDMLHHNPSHVISQTYHERCSEPHGVCSGDTTGATVLAAPTIRAMSDRQHKDAASTDKLIPFTRTPPSRSV